MKIMKALKLDWLLNRGEKQRTVKMAYNLILGREPESKKVLNRKFDSIMELRDQFINSPEFKIIMHNLIGGGRG